MTYFVYLAHALNCNTKTNGTKIGLLLKTVDTSISFYKKLGLRFAYINLNVKDTDRTPISSWFM